VDAPVREQDAATALQVLYPLAPIPSFA